VAVLDAGRGERGERRGAQALGRADEVELDQLWACWRRGPRSVCACCSAYSL